MFSPHYCSFTLLPLSYIFLSWQHLFHMVACTALLYESWMAELQPGFNWMHLCSVYWYMQYCVPPLKKNKNWRWNDWHHLNLQTSLWDKVHIPLYFQCMRFTDKTVYYIHTRMTIRIGISQVWSENSYMNVRVLCPLCKFTIYLWSPRKSPPVGYEST